MWLYVTVSALFPLENVIEEHVSDLTFSGGRPMSFDVYIPRLKLAFEFQGPLL